MTSRLSFLRVSAGVAGFLTLGLVCCFAAATLTQKMDPQEIAAGDQTVVTISVQNGTVDAFHLPVVQGLQPAGSRSLSNLTYSNGSITRGTTFSFVISAPQPGVYVIPAFDLHTREGEVLHVAGEKLYVDGAGAVIPGSAPASSAHASAQPPAAAPTNPNGPVVIPPAPTPANAADASGANSNVPRDPDGTPAKVFMVITPQTTQAYVGQSVPMEIEFFIREDVNWQQNSLPTIKGSDFLMNSFTTRGHTGVGTLENVTYIRESWLTSISAPKSGDFPLSMERDTYWIKSVTNSNVLSIFGNSFGRQANLAHEMIASNLLTMHVQPLPEEGRPAHFTGAIGQFKVDAEASPDTVNFGDPVTLRFTVSGTGNFDYVRCPALADDVEWKAYVPRSGTNYLEESHTEAVKSFEQSVIPKKNGNVPLPAASFSYFDLTTKQYVTIPITLPYIVVTGTPPPMTESAADGGADASSLPVAPKAVDLQPNQIEIGALQTNLDPVYRHAWFWAVQSTLVTLPIAAALLLLLRPRSAVDSGIVLRDQRRRFARIEEDSMADALRRDDALAFFTAARHALQLQLGAQWSESPEAITLGEIRRRDPLLAERLAPFFAQADEVIYSGKASVGLDLGAWDRRVREELQQPQPA